MALLGKAMAALKASAKVAKAAAAAPKAGLTAVKRADKNGKVVTRHVVDDAAKASKSRNRKRAAVAAVGTVATAHYGRNVFNEKASPDVIARDWEQLPADMSIYHTQGKGNEGNRKYIDRKTGRNEAVLTPDGKHVTDHRNMASFNFFGPKTLGGVPHVLTDVLPYYALGNTPQDFADPARFTTTAKLIRSKIKG